MADHVPRQNYHSAGGGASGGHNHLIPSNCKNCCKEVEKFPKFCVVKGDPIGQGGFGSVIKGYLNAVDNPQASGNVVIKMLHTPIAQKRYSVIQDMFNLKHKNLIKFIGIVDTDPQDCPQLIFQFVNEGNLLDYVKNPQTFKGLDLFNKFTLDIIHGMEYLHQMNFIHGCLSARNVLLQNLNGFNNAKISDYGMSRVITGSGPNYFSYIVGKSMPIRWLPRECIPVDRNVGEISKSADVWSFGVVLWEMLTLGEIPYGIHCTNLEVKQHILNGSSPLAFRRPDKCDPTIIQFMENIFVTDPEQRPTFEILKLMLQSTTSADAPKAMASSKQNNDDKQRSENSRQNNYGRGGGRRGGRGGRGREEKDNQGYNGGGNATAGYGNRNEGSRRGGRGGHYDDKSRNLAGHGHSQSSNSNYNNRGSSGVAAQNTNHIPALLPTPNTEKGGRPRNSSQGQPRSWQKRDPPKQQRTGYHAVPPPSYNRNHHTDPPPPYSVAVPPQNKLPKNNGNNNNEKPSVYANTAYKTSTTANTSVVATDVNKKVQELQEQMEAIKLQEKEKRDAEAAEEAKEEEKRRQAEQFLKEHRQKNIEAENKEKRRLQEEQEREEARRKIVQDQLKQERERELAEKQQRQKALAEQQAALRKQKTLEIFEENKRRQQELKDSMEAQIIQNELNAKKAQEEKDALVAYQLQEIQDDLYKQWEEQQEREKLEAIETNERRKRAVLEEQRRLEAIEANERRKRDALKEQEQRRQEAIEANERRKKDALKEQEQRRLEAIEANERRKRAALKEQEQRRQEAIEANERRKRDALEEQRRQNLRYSNVSSSGPSFQRPVDYNLRTLSTTTTTPQLPASSSASTGFQRPRSLSPTRKPTNNQREKENCVVM